MFSPPHTELECTPDDSLPKPPLTEHAVRVAEFSIGEVAKRAGIAASAIRFYEAEGLIPKAPRRSGRRMYDPSILDRLSLIELAKSAGFTMAEIKRLVALANG